ncbi:MAG: hypothetical protein ACOYN0_03075 [Phycisphaerales bacterium]
MNPVAATAFAFVASLLVMGGYALRLCLALRARSHRHDGSTNGGRPNPPAGRASTSEVKPLSRVKAS